MGEIIIKIPEEIKETIEINLPYSEIKKKIEELKKEEKLKFLKRFTDKYLGKLDIPEIKEDELYK